MNTLLSLCKDYLASHFRSQLNTLSAVLELMENSEHVGDDCADESLKHVEMNVRKLRKTYRQI